MITNRKKSGVVNYPIFSANSIGFDIPWEDIVTLVSYIAKDLFTTSSNNKLYEKDSFVFTREEIISLCNLPLYSIDDPANIVKLDIEDLYDKNVISNMVKHNNRSIPMNGVEGFMFVLRDIEIGEQFRLPNPGFRIEINLSSDNRFILTIIHDVDAPKNTENLVRLAGEIAECVIQAYMIFNGVSLYYDSPDFNTYSDLGNSSVYKATATIVLKDFPTIKDILFEFDYIRTIYCSIMTIVKETIDIYPSVDCIIKNYFTQIVADLGEWSLSMDEFRELFEDNVYSDPDYSKYWTALSVDYGVKKSCELYLNAPA